MDASGRKGRRELSVGLGRFAAIALDCVHRPYPYHLTQVVRGDEDVRTPRELTPAFYGCFDWHSAVHGHWLLARFVRTEPDHELAERARSALDASFTPERLAGELAHLRTRPTFERPYGLAWLLALHAEARACVASGRVPFATRWELSPLAELAAERFREWLPKLRFPIRTGVHSQTAFAIGLGIDWARAVGDWEMESFFASVARAHHEGDRDLPLHLEPSGEDFLSPSLAAADLMTRVLEAPDFAAWLDRALPGLHRDGGWSLEPAIVSDPTDGRLAHLDGLNLSRAWMLRRVARALPDEDPRIEALGAAASAHETAGLGSIGGEHYEGAHWLGTFAAYLSSFGTS